MPRLHTPGVNKLDIIDAITRTVNRANIFHFLTGAYGQAVLSNHSFDKYLTGDRVPFFVKSLSLLCKDELESANVALADTMKRAQVDSCS